jgi:hypothetical protein
MNELAFQKVVLDLRLVPVGLPKTKGNSKKEGDSSDSGEQWILSLKFKKTVSGLKFRSQKSATLSDRVRQLKLKFLHIEFC